MAPKIHVSLLRRQYEAIERQISNIIIRSDENLIKLGKKKDHLVQLSNQITNKIEKIPVTERGEVELLFDKIWDSISRIDDTESKWQKSVPSPEKSPSSSPPKPKKTKVEEFAEKIKDVKKDPVQVTIVATEIIACLESDITVLNSKFKVAESKLAARPNLEIFRDRIIPTWLMGKSYVGYRDKLILSLYFDLTPTAKLIRERMNDYTHTCLLSVVDTIMLFYNTLSVKICHDGKPNIMSLTNEEWIKLCEDVDFKDPVRICIIQKLLAPVNIEDIDRKQVALRYHFIYVNYLDIDVARNTENEITDFIKNVCGENFTYGEFFYPVNKEKHTNEVYFQIFTTKNNVVNQIEEKLGKHAKAGKNIFFRSQFVQRV